MVAVFIVWIKFCLYWGVVHTAPYSEHELLWFLIVLLCASRTISRIILRHILVVCNRVRLGFICIISRLTTIDCRRWALSWNIISQLLHLDFSLPSWRLIHKLDVAMSRCWCRTDLEIFVVSQWLLLLNATLRIWLPDWVVLGSLNVARLSILRLSRILSIFLFDDIIKVWIEFEHLLFVFLRFHSRLWLLSVSSWCRLIKFDALSKINLSFQRSYWYLWRGRDLILFLTCYFVYSFK